MAVVNPAVLNALVFQHGKTAADLDDQENRRRISHDTAIGKMQRNYQDVEETNRTGFSDRGMLHAGASVKNQMELQEDLTRNKSEAGTSLATDLATIARRRLENTQDLKNQQLLATLGLTPAS